MSYLGIFGLEFWKRILLFQISTLKFVKNAFSTHTINVSIGSTFSNRQGQLFLKVPVLVQARFIKKALFCQLIDRKVVNLISKYSQLAGDTKQVFSSLPK